MNPMRSYEGNPDGVLKSLEGFWEETLEESQEEILEELPERSWEQRGAWNYCG